MFIWFHKNLVSIVVALGDTKEGLREITMLSSWFPAVIAFSSTLLLVPACMKVARMVGLVDNPANRKIHRVPVPYLGGVAIFLGLFFSLILFSNTLIGTEKFKLWGILVATASTALFGLVDDKFQVRARVKLSWQILCALAFVIISGYKFEVLRLPAVEPLILDRLSLPVTILWVTAIVNGINLIDGMDGLAGSVCVGILSIIAVLAGHLNDRICEFIAILAAACTSAFLIFNWRPAKIYLGDAGSTGLGMLVATLLVSLGRTSGPAAPIEPFPYQILAVSMIVIYPTLEVGLSVLRRFLRGKSIGSADKAHIHHRLVANGCTAPVIAFVAAGLTALSGLTIYFFLADLRGLSAWFLPILGAAISILLNYCGYLTTFHPDNIRDSRPHFKIANHFISMQRAKLALAESVPEVALLIEQTCIEFNVTSYRMCLSRAPDPLTITWNGVATVTSLSREKIPFACPTTEKFALTSKSDVEWEFPVREVEEDIDVEHRVLVSDFMREALSRAEDLLKIKDTEPSLALTPVLTTGVLRLKSLRLREPNNLAKE